MTTIKSFTSLEHSRKLAKILPLESADMVYFGIHQGMDGKYHLSGTNTEDDVVPIYKNLCTKVFVKATESDITCQLPCWSISALLCVLPKYEIYNFGDTIQLDVNLEALATEGDETLLDLVVNMIIHLHELKML